MADNQQLWGQFKSGDRKAFDEIYQLHIDTLYRYGYKFSKDTNLIEDCIHDLFIYLWKNRDTIAHTDTIKPYLLTSFRNRIIKEIKKSQKTKLSDKDEMESHFDAELSREQAIVQEESIIENKEMLEALFKELSARQKEAVYLKFYQQLSSDAICTIMGINNQSYRNVLSTAIKKMRGIIAK